MINELNIEHFKLFKHLNISNLKRVNLFAGKNNCGKTALLEALRILSANRDLSVMLYILQKREQTSFNPINIYDPFFNRQLL